MEQIRSLSQLLDYAKKIGAEKGPKKLSVAMAEEAGLLTAIEEARKAGVATQLGHAGLEAGAGAGAGEEEQHGQHFVAQIGVGFAQGALALQVQRHVDDGVNLVSGPFLGRDHVTPA